VTRSAVRVARRLDDALRKLRDSRATSRLATDPNAPALVLSPHFDDAVINCWSVLTSDADVRVVNVFAQAPAAGSTTLWDRICGAEDSRAHMQERLREDAEALAVTGREALNLPFLDSQYRRGRPALARLDAALAAVVPAASAVYAPAGLGFEPHVDHVLVRRLALAASRNGVPVSLYADVPYAVAFGWPAWVTGAAAPDRLDLDAFWQRLAREVPAIANLRDAEVARLPAAESQRKLAAMRAYRTQFAALDGGSIGLLQNPLIHGFEVFWTVKPA
jgi:LmbE family N-acetylglucosaminyl deacetylase